MNLGDLNRRITVEIWEYSTDIAGGVTASVSDSWEQLANVVIRSGSNTDVNAQSQWTYDAKFKMRKLLEVKSNYTITYADQRYKIDSVKVTDERRQQFYEILATKVDGNV